MKYTDIIQFKKDQYEVTTLTNDISCTIPFFCFYSVFYLFPESAMHSRIWGHPKQSSGIGLFFGRLFK